MLPVERDGRLDPPLCARRCHADAAGHGHGREQRDRRDPGRRRARGGRRRPARCSTPTLPRQPARSRSTWRAIDLLRSAATSSTGQRASARSMCGGARAYGSRRCSPAAGRSVGCAQERCRRRSSSALARHAGSPRGDGRGGPPARGVARAAAGAAAPVPVAINGPGNTGSPATSTSPSPPPAAELMGRCRSFVSPPARRAVRPRSSPATCCGRSGSADEPRRAPCALGWDDLPARPTSTSPPMRCERSPAPDVARWTEA